uniref:Uncharacterized protein n=1 Tax=Arundo donax TaxID=35708 RepID=A0A0A9DDF3_ARUDO
MRPGCFQFSLVDLSVFSHSLLKMTTVPCKYRRSFWESSHLVHASLRDPQSYNTTKEKKYLNQHKKKMVRIHWMEHLFQRAMRYSAGKSHPTGPHFASAGKCLLCSENTEQEISFHCFQQMKATITLAMQHMYSTRHLEYECERGSSETYHQKMLLEQTAKTHRTSILDGTELDAGI